MCIDYPICASISPHFKHARKLPHCSGICLPEQAWGELVEAHQYSPRVSLTAAVLVECLAVEILQLWASIQSQLNESTWISHDPLHGVTVFALR